jgi:threonine dehydrogenase-like Zn-dependent dehydrogenase
MGEPVIVVAAGSGDAPAEDTSAAFAAGAATVIAADAADQAEEAAQTAATAATLASSAESTAFSAELRTAELEARIEDLEDVVVELVGAFAGDELPELVDDGAPEVVVVNQPEENGGDDQDDKPERKRKRSGHYGSDSWFGSRG